MKQLKKLLFIALLLVNSVFAAQPLDSVVATVNDGVILQSDVQNMLNTIKHNANLSHTTLPDDTVLRKQILNRLIIDTAILQKAKNMGINVDDNTLNSAIEGIAQQHHLSVTQMQQELKSQGINYQDYRAQVRREMLISNVRNAEVGPLINVMPQEVDQLAKQLASQYSDDTEFNLSQIFIPIPENPTTSDVIQAQQLITQILSELKQGEDFHKLAVSYSTGAGALEGGNIGWTKLENLPPPITEALQSSKTGSIVGPIQSSIGFYIFLVNDIRDVKPKVSVTEIHTRHILIRPSIVLNDQQARAKIEKIADELNQGADFAKLAEQYSEDPGSAAKGGDLGWQPAEKFDPTYKDAALKLKTNQISQPIRTSFGWDIIQLLGKRDTDKTEDALKQRAYNTLFNRKFNEEAQIWMQQQRVEAYVKILDPQYN